MITRAKIVKNAVKCAYCGAIIESRHRHDFVTHSCEAMCAAHMGRPTYIGVDGGADYLKRVGTIGDYIEASEYQ